MKKIILLVLVIQLACITDEKTNCYNEKQAKNREGFIFSPCDAWVFGYALGEVRNPNSESNDYFRNAAVLGCLNDELIYRQCKNKSQIKPVIGTGDVVE